MLQIVIIFLFYPYSPKNRNKVVFFPNRHHHTSHVFRRLDPRSRILGAVAFAVVVSCLSGWFALSVALGVAVLAVGLGRISGKSVILRITPLNLVVLTTFLLIPWSWSNLDPETRDALFQIGPLDYDREKFRLALRFALTGNSIVLGFVAMLGNLEPATLGQSLGSLGLPSKLTQLFLLTIRYLSVLEEQWSRMQLAAKVRGFRPRFNLLTYLTYAAMIGHLLLRALDRSERVLAAMRCRGFNGTFRSIERFRFGAADAWFAAALLSLFAAFFALQG